MNITEFPLKNKPPTVGGHSSTASSNYRAWRDAVADELQARGHYDEAERWDYCDNSPRYKVNRKNPDLPPTTEAVWVCSQSHEHDTVLFSSSCDFRICPDCAKKHTARLMSRYIPVIEEQLRLHQKYKLRTLTLTRSIQLGDDGFKAAAQNGFELIQKLMFEVVGEKWRKDGAGLLANWEVGPNGLKLHYHLVYLGPWVDQKRLSRTWEKLTGGDKIVWVKAINVKDGDWQGAVSETLKYATKFYSEDKETGERIYLSPSLTVDLFEALKGTRRIRSWGSFYNIEKEVERVFCCLDCGSKMARITIGYYELWRLTGFSDVGWRQAIARSLLQYRTANKSPPKKVKTDKPSLPQDRMLPVFDKIPTKGISHYDYE